MHPKEDISTIEQKIERIKFAAKIIQKLQKSKTRIEWITVTDQCKFKIQADMDPYTAKSIEKMFQIRKKEEEVEIHFRQKE